MKRLVEVLRSLTIDEACIFSALFVVTVASIIGILMCGR